jgi:hypothetical protein
MVVLFTGSLQHQVVTSGCSIEADTAVCASIKYFYSDETIFEIYIEKEVAKGQCLVFI